MRMNCKMSRGTIEEDNEGLCKTSSHTAGVDRFVCLFVSSFDMCVCVGGGVCVFCFALLCFSHSLWTDGDIARNKKLTS